MKLALQFLQLLHELCCQTSPAKPWCWSTLLIPLHTDGMLYQFLEAVNHEKTIQRIAKSTWEFKPECIYKHEEQICHPPEKQIKD